MLTCSIGQDRHLTVGIVALTAVLLLTACTTASSDQSDSTSTALAGLQQDGKIRVGTDPTYAPNEFLDEDGKTVIGFDKELFDAIAAAATPGSR